MREVTVAKGKLRCGECHKVFNASATLSTSMPEPYSERNPRAIKKKPQQQSSRVAAEVTADRDSNNTNPKRLITANEKQTATPTKTEIRSAQPTQKTQTRTYEKPDLQVGGIQPPFYKSKGLLLLITLLLTLLLAAQVLYSYRHFFSDEPRHRPDKISMVNYNVFAHPIESGVLLISATMENNASHDQPYPMLELRLTDSQSRLVALRRFTADEYLDNYAENMLLKKNQTTGLKLKIKDPGTKATRFQFNFL